MMPLRGVRIIDLSRLLPGSWASLILSDLGAEVIKIEHPDQGDDVRGVGPMVEGHSAVHRFLNRGKKSGTLDLKQDEGRALFLKLVETADVVLESFRPGVLDRLNMNFDTLRLANSRIVLCSLTGDGQTGPRCREAGHDINYVGYAGILGLNGNGNGVPIFPSVPIADLGGGGSMAVIAILSGLWARQSTQVAQWIDVSMLDGAVSWLPVLMAENLGPHGLGQQTALFSGGYACYTTYPTQDGRFMCVGAIEPKFWQTFCETLNVSHFVGQQLAPMGRQAEMKAMLNAKFLQHPQKYWIDQFADIEACCTPVLSLGEVMNDQQLQERSMIDRRADMPYIGRPIQWMGVEPEPIDTKTAALGEDTAATLADIGVSVDQLEALKDGGVV